MNTRLKSERLDEILSEIQRKGVLTIAELAAYLNVSEITVRRDLDELHEAGALERVRGGARPLSSHGQEPPVVQRETSQISEKREIAAVAAELIVDGDVIGLESGSTTLEIARCIARKSWKRLTVITNSFTITQELIRVPGIQLVFIGGVVLVDEMGTFGVLAAEFIRKIRIDKLFMGCRGIDPEFGISNDLQAEQEVETMQALVAASLRMICVTDYSKFGKTFLIQSIPVTKIDTLITDHGTPKHYVEKFRKQDIQVLLPQKGVAGFHGLEDKSTDTE
jgi:DeoR/GlpR family transcriptional regulator of sugar metabolism